MIGHNYQRSLWLNNKLDEAGVPIWRRASFLQDEIGVPIEKITSWLNGDLSKEIYNMHKIQDKFDVDLGEWITGGRLDSKAIDRYVLVVISITIKH